MDISIFLARCMGLYFFIVGAAVLINRTTFPSMVKGIIQNRELLFLMGINILIIGILLVVSHNFWVMNWTLLITIIAWITFIKGILNLLYPRVAVQVSKRVMQHPSSYLMSAGINLLLGIYFLYFGYLAYYGSGF